MAGKTPPTGKPKYKQIAEQIEQRIASGEFPPGSYLPSERKQGSGSCRKP